MNNSPSERQARVLELADEFIKTGRYPTKVKGHSASLMLLETSSRLMSVLTIPLAILGIGAVLASSSSKEQNRQ